MRNTDFKFVVPAAEKTDGLKLLTFFLKLARENRCNPWFYE